MSANAVYDLYRSSSLFVWVEDELTRDVLQQVWGHTRINLSVAGSKDMVRALVQGAPELVKAKVIGLVDRDLGESNIADWGNKAQRILTTSRHEFENELLDFEVMAAIATRSGTAVTAVEVETEARKHAQDLLVWMACKATLHSIKAEVRPGYPGDPPADTVPTLKAAADYILNSEEWKITPGAWKKWTLRPQVESTLAARFHDYEASIADGTWIEVFSGKEIFGRLRGSSALGLESPKEKKASRATRDLDLAKKIAREMAAQKKPPSLLLLRDSLLARFP